MQLKSIRTRFALWTGVGLGVTVATFIGYSVVTARANALASAQRAAIVEAESDAARMKAELEYALKLTRALAKSLTTARETPGAQLSRANVSALLHGVLLDNPRFVAVYTEWEPDAFDGRDREFRQHAEPGESGERGKQDESSEAKATGRFKLTWGRGADGKVSTDVMDMDDDDTTLYQTTKQRMSETLIEPHFCMMEGKQELETSLTAPIVVEGRYLGMVGVDLALDALQRLADGIDLYDGAGRLVLVSEKGLVAGATGNRQLLKQPLETALPELAGFLPALQEGKRLSELTEAEFRVLAPLSIGQSGTPWGAIITIPRAVIFAASTQYFWRQIWLGALLLALMVMLIWLLAGQLVKPISAAAQFAESIARGDALHQVPVTTRDETGRLLRAMNSMLVNADSLVQTREERDNMQRSVLQLLKEVHIVGRGDLTRHAEVRDDLTGDIAKSFNHMIDELRRIVGDVKEAAEEVGATADQAQQTTQHLADAAEDYAAQILDAAHEVESLAHSIHSVSQSAQHSKTVAQEALFTAKRGARFLQDSMQGMNQLQAQTKETARRIQRLGEHSQGIKEIVELIRDIAARLSNLALSARIEAAQAGAAGRGFVGVAAGVERLAERSEEASKRIVQLVERAELGAREAGAAVADSQKTVDAGAELIQKVGQELGEIETVSLQLAQLVQGIADVVQDHTQKSTLVTQRMARISQASKETTEGIQQAAHWLNRLAGLAEALNHSVSSFKVLAVKYSSRLQPNGDTVGKLRGYLDSKTSSRRLA